jgi:hypothetical protein
MRISEIFMLENLSINVPYHRLTTTVKCVFGQVKTAPNLSDWASENDSEICSIPEEQND